MGYGLLSGILWGLGTVILGLALTRFAGLPLGQSAIAAPVISAFLHDSAAFLWMFLYSAVRGRLRKLIQAFRLRDGKVIMVGAILGGPVGMTAYALAMNRIGPGYTAVITSIYPVVGAVLASVFLKQKFLPRQWLGLLVSIAAIIGLSYSSQNDVDGFAIGAVLALLAVFGWAGEGLVAAYGMRNEGVGNEEAIIIRQGTSALFFAALILPIAGLWPQAITVASDFSVSGFILLAGLMGGFSYLFYYLALHRIGVGKGMALNMTYSAWAVLFDYLILGNRPGVQSLIFCVIIIVGAIVAAYKKDEDD